MRPNRLKLAIYEFGASAARVGYGSGHRICSPPLIGTCPNGLHRGPRSVEYLADGLKPLHRLPCSMAGDVLPPMRAMLSQKTADCELPEDRGAGAVQRAVSGTQSAIWTCSAGARMQRLKAAISKVLTDRGSWEARLGTCRSMVASRIDGLSHMPTRLRRRRIHRWPAEPVRVRISDPGCFAGA